MVSQREIGEFLAEAMAIARDAGAILQERYGKEHAVRFKGPVDLVTEADAASEELIARRLQAVFPDHHLLGEEGARGAAESAASPFRWVVDPLDGTTNFAHSLPHFAVSIGLEHRGVPVVGVVYDPLRDEVFSGARGQGAFLNGRPIQVSATPELMQAIVATGFSVRPASSPRSSRGVAGVPGSSPEHPSDRIIGAQPLLRGGGRLDGYWERGIAPWDVAAGALIALEAGASVTNFEGGSFLSDDREVVASNGPLHPAMLDILLMHAPRPPVEPGKAAG